MKRSIIIYVFIIFIFEANIFNFGIVLGIEKSFQILRGIIQSFQEVAIDTCHLNDRETRTNIQFFDITRNNEYSRY